MPGPLAKDRRTKSPFRGEKGTPNRKTEKRLAKRLATVPSSGFLQTGMKTSFFHKPGSQNRNKH